MKTILILYQCPTCGAKLDEPCRTPKGRKRKSIHDDRPFGISGDELYKSDKDKPETS